MWPNLSRPAGSSICSATWQAVLKLICWCVYQCQEQIASQITKDTGKGDKSTDADILEIPPAPWLCDPCPKPSSRALPTKILIAGKEIMSMLRSFVSLLFRKAKPFTSKSRSLQKKSQSRREVMCWVPFCWSTFWRQVFLSALKALPGTMTNQLTALSGKMTNPLIALSGKMTNTLITLSGTMINPMMILNRQMTEPIVTIFKSTINPPILALIPMKPDTVARIRIKTFMLLS